MNQSTYTLGHRILALLCALALAVDLMPTAALAEAVMPLEEPAVTEVILTNGETPITTDPITIYTTEPNKKLPLTAEVAPAGADATVNWSSDTPEVATVDNNGVVTAVAAGTATITATATNGTDSTDDDMPETCTVSVKKHVDTITLTPATTVLTITNTVSNPTTTIAVAYNPEDADDDEKNLTWESSDSNVATVANGSVTALKAGTTTITAKNSNDVSGRCDITVTETTATGITIKRGDAEVSTPLEVVYGEPVQLTAAVEPVDAVGTVEWNSGNPEAVSVDGTGKVTVNKVVDGDVTITAKIGEQTKDCKIITKKKAVEITNLVFDSRPYDGKITLSDVPTITLNPAVANAVVEGLTFTVESASPGLNKAVSVTANGLSIKDNPNYQVTMKTGLNPTITITPKVLDVTLKEQIYNGTNTYSEVVATVDGLVEENAVTEYQITASAESKIDAGNDKDVTITWPGDDARDTTNYTWPTTGKLTVNPKPITFSVKVADKGYDGTTAVKAILYNTTTDAPVGDDVSTQPETGTFTNSLTEDNLEFIGTGVIDNDTENVGVKLKENATVSISLNRTETTNYVPKFTIDSANITKNSYPEDTGFALPNADYTQNTTEGSIRWYKVESENRTIGIAAMSGYAIASEEGGAYAGSISVSPSENDAVTVFVKKTADNTLSKEIVNNIKVDYTAPSIDTEGAAGNLAFGQDGSVTYTIKVTDEDSGVNPETVEYCISNSSSSSDGAEWTQAVVDGGVDNGYTFTVTAPKTGYVYVKATDNVGNTYETSSIRALVLETRMPMVTATCADAGDAAKTHTIRWTASDAEEAGSDPYSYSGIRLVTYELKKDGTTVQTGNLIENSAPTEMSGLPSVRAYDGHYSIDNTNLDGEYTLTVTATDFCGNSQTSAPLNLQFDHTPPKVTVVMSGGVEMDGTFFYNANNCGITITVEDNYLAQGISYTAALEGRDNRTGTLSDGTNVIAFSNEEVAASGDSISKTLTLSLTDKAGNSTSAITGRTGVIGSDMKAIFALDTTPPRLTVVTTSVATSGLYTDTNAAYYNADSVTTTFTIEEANMPAQWDLSYTADNSTQPADVAASDEGKVSVILTEEGTYSSIAVAGQDKAGNKLELGNVSPNSEDVVSCNNGKAVLTYAKVLDRTAPTAVITYPATANPLYPSDAGENTGTAIYYNSDATIEIQIADTYGTIAVPIDPAKLTAKLNGSTGVTVSNTGAASVSVTEDSRNTVAVFGTDRAGNTLQVKEIIDGKQGSETPLVNALDSYASVYTVVRDTVAPVLTLDFNNTDTTGSYYEADKGTHYYPENGKYRAYYGNTVTTIVPLVTSIIDANGVDYSRIFSAKNESAFAPLGADKTYCGENGSERAMVEEVTVDGDYLFFIYGTDKAGNALVVKENKKTSDEDVDDAGTSGCGDVEHKYSTYPKTLDTKAPEVVLSYAFADDTPLEATHYYDNNAYYKNSFAATFAYSDENGIDLTKVFKTAAVSEGSGFDVVETNPSADLDKIEIPASVDNNGHYQFGAYGVDKAGNALTVKEKNTSGPAAQTAVYPGKNADNKFVSDYHKVLDTVNPVATITVDAGNSLRKELQTNYNNRYYFNDSFTTTIAVEETNYDAAKVTARVGSVNSSTVEQNGKTLQTQEVSATSVLATQQAASPYGYQQQITADGVYCFDLKGVDRAGNQIILNGGNRAANFVQSTLSDTSAVSGEPADRYVTYVFAEDKTAPVLNVTMKDPNNKNNGFNQQTGNFYEATLTSIGYQLSTNYPYRSSKVADFAFTTKDNSPVTVLYKVDSTAANSNFAYERNGAAGMIGQAGAAGAEAYADGLAYTQQTADKEQILQINSLLIEDLAGNQVSYSKTENENKIYLDVSAPTDDQLQPVVRLSYPSPVTQNTMSHRDISGVNLYKDTVVVTADVMDPYTNASQEARGSGLYRVYYKVTVNGESQTGKVGIQTGSGKSAVAADDGVYYIDYNTTGQSGPVNGGNETLTASDKLTFTFNPNDGVFNYNSIVLMVWAVDNANNEIADANKAIYKFGIDVTAPIIEISYDNNDAENEKYFKADRTATVVVTERNFDESKIDIVTESNSISGWSYSAGAAANGDEDKWTCTISYNVDGVYTLNISGADQLGINAASVTYDGVAPQSFVIDKTAPVVDVTFDNNDVRNGKYYNQSRTATVSVTDVNFNGVNAIDVSAAVGGAAPAVSFNGLTATLPFTTDGTYSFRGTVTDMAGNVSQEFTVDEFVIDQTAPELSIEGVEDLVAYPGEVLPRIVFSDQNYEGNTIQLLRTVLDQKNVDVSELIVPNGGVTAGADGLGTGSIAYEDLEHVQENDGIYTLTASVTDLAGNSTEDEVTYSVNRFGSVYVYSDALTNMIGAYKQKADEGLYISAYNVSPLIEDSTKLQISCDGASLSNQNSKAVVTGGTQAGNSGWYEYRFDISGRDLTGDGRYEITLSDKDEAGNTKTNAENPIWFYIDATKPSLDSVIGLENSIVNADSQTVSFMASDAIALSSIQVYIDDEQIQQATDFETTAYESEFQVGTGLRHKIRFVITDKAGNVLDTDEDSFAPSYTFNKVMTVSTNFFVRWFANTPLFVGSIAVGAGGIGTVAFVFIRKRRLMTVSEDD